MWIGVLGVVGGILGSVVGRGGNGGGGGGHRAGLMGIPWWPSVKYGRCHLTFLHRRNSV